jgi:very-short-patch-repair endonuclease
MSLTIKRELRVLAKLRARELRKKMTPSERIFWEQVRDRRFLGKKFLRQHPLFIDEDGKETFYITDFYCHEELLAVEIDGAIHLNQKDRDRLRSIIMNANGIRVIRFSNDEIEKDIQRVMEQLKLYLENESVH